jgi:hypothetical protein
LHRSILALGFIAGLGVTGSVPAHGASDGGSWPDTTATGKTHFLDASYQYGSVLQTNGFVKGENNQGEPIEKYQSLRLEFGWQTDGAWPWQQLYNYPAYGIGIMGADYFQFEDEIGNPTSLYGFFRWPVKRWHVNTITVDLALGLSDNWKPFDPVDNPNNVAIGAFRTIMIDVGATYNLGISRRFGLMAGIEGTHFSNGGTRKPNQGLNMLTGSVGLKYFLGSGRPELPAKRPLPAYVPSWEILATLAGGINNINFETDNEDVVEKYKNVDYAVINLSGTVNRGLGRMSKVGAGLDFTYDNSIGAQIDAADGEVNDVATSFGDKLAVGVFGGYEQVIDRGSILLQLGYQVVRTDFEGSLPEFYQRLGVRYYVLKNTFLGLNVRFHDFGVADYLEFNLGQRWEIP